MHKRKKILAISYLFPNSEQPNHGIFVLNRLKAMSKYADITVINPIADSPVHKHIDKFKGLQKIPLQEELLGVHVYHPRFFSIPGHLKSLEVISYRRAVWSIVKTLPADFDLIDLHWTFPDLPTGAWLSKKFDIPFNVTLRGMEAFHLQDSGLRKHIVSYYLKKVDKVISLSEEMAQTANELAETANKTTVIRNGVDTNKFYYLDKKECREKLNLPLNEKIILGVGALIYRKGFDLVIKGLKKIIATKGLENTKFYILGSQGPEGDYRRELNQFIEQHNLQEQVVFVGAVANSELITWYNAADVFCLSSRGEGSPNVLTEALACGTPAVATNVGSVPEIMTSEDNLGYYVENENQNEITNRLIDLLSSEHDRNKQALVFKKYTWDWCAKEVMDVLN
ncbi:glycosyltransferase [Colwellia sp. 1_MG-2023]|uniref:glycosyltransferase n=1 Tax=unclassified Colwellia TaxID=196834 RepID=UPI001C096FD6|nr:MULTISPECIES: glycosyltransferase [unclassified Colwellia]MBU2924935.1 glycosyltransferase [Colwellia sp. C2M11]MDO6652833.1 glycosyltransferase [Colwellia sp. 3_MG-2023]MDO6665835.1 glycosyltransferase [Colwellia sp. 2_MG-2023]MDO6690208.1 glycosyltransferase [Colwellia sp. 1_MG-2023]